MKTIIKGYCEIKNGEFVRFGKSLDDWPVTYANPIGDIVKCKVTIEYDHPLKERTANE